MKNFLMIAFSAALILIGVSAYSQQNIILDSDSAKPFEGFGRYFVTPSPTSPTASTKPSGSVTPEKSPTVDKVLGEEVVFKIVKVTNIQGNNPLNPSQPVYNFGGVLVANVDELVDCVRGGTCKGSSSVGIVCSPSTGDSDVASLKDSVGCYIKGNGTICRVERLPSTADLKYETLFVMYDSFVSNTSVAGTDTKSDYNMIKPPTSSSVSWGPTTVYKVSNGTYTAEVQHKGSGAKYRINFTVTNLPGNNVRLTVNSLTRIN